MPVGFNITYVKDKVINGRRGNFFFGIFSILEGENVQLVRDLAYEEAILVAEGSCHDKISAINVPLAIDDSVDTYIDFDAP